MFDALGVGFGGLRGNADSHQKFDHQSMARPDPRGQGLAGVGEENAAVGPRRGDFPPS